MAKNNERRFDMTGLKVMQSALKKLKDGDHIIQVGVFGDKAMRKNEENDQGLTNAEIGLIHEMGSTSRNIPRRSFLWDTFTNHGKDLEPVLKKDVEELLKKGKVEAYLKRAGIAATNLVVEAFQTSGWGSWAQNAPATIWRKLGRVKNFAKRRQMMAEVLYEGATHTKPLIQTGQLWQAISFRTAKA